MLGIWDFLIILFLVIGTGYGFIFRKGQIVVLFISSYISFVVVSELGVKVFNFLDKTARISQYGSWTESVVKIVLFLAIMVLLAIWGEYLAASSGKKGLFNLIFSGVYGLLFATMLLSIISLFLSLNLEMEVLALSRLSPYIISYRTWWFLLPIALIFISGFWLSRKKK